MWTFSRWCSFPRQWLSPIFLRTEASPAARAASAHLAHTKSAHQSPTPRSRGTLPPLLSPAPLQTKRPAGSNSAPPERRIPKLKVRSPSFFTFSRSFSLQNVSCLYFPVLDPFTIFSSSIVSVYYRPLDPSRCGAKRVLEPLHTALSSLFLSRSFFLLLFSTIIWYLFYSCAIMETKEQILQGKQIVSQEKRDS